MRIKKTLIAVQFIMMLLKCGWKLCSGSKIVMNRPFAMSKLCVEKNI